MKKILLVFTMAALLLCACSKKGINDPSELSVKDKIIQYSDTKETVDDLLGDSDKSEILHYDSYIYDDALEIIYDEKDNIRYIKITDKSVTTYKDISVGDSINKVAEEFDYEQINGSRGYVLFNGNEEEDQTSRDRKDDWIFITYNIDDFDEIEEIYICDIKFAKFMK